jgi:hypothetical protein
MEWYRRPVVAPVTQQDRDTVRHVQKVLTIPETGNLDEETSCRIRGLQALFGLRVTGVIDDATARQVDRIWPEGA